MCRVASFHKHHFDSGGVLDVVEKVVERQGELEVGAAVRDGGWNSGWFWAAFGVIERVEPLYAVFRWVLLIGRVVGVWIRACYEDRACKGELTGEVKGAPNEAHHRAIM
jgi:hypothetical protein